MALLPPSTLRSILKAHGMRPYDLVVEFVGEQSSSFFTQFGNVQWQERPVKAQSLNVGYGSDGYSFTFSCWDPASVEAPHMTSPTTQLKVPRNGEFVVVTCLDQTTGPTGRVVFRGTIRSVHEHVVDGGTSYNCEAISEVSRLNDLHVTFVANFRNDPVNPTPRFDSNGQLLSVVKLKTVYEIAQDIFNFRDPWNSTEFFGFQDIDWNGLDTDPRCGGYVPPTITYQDTPKGKAFEDLLQRAGNFHFIYVPQRNGRGKLRVVELNLACNNCGDGWSLKWAPATLQQQISQANYAYDYVVGEDNTEWNTKESANVVRLTTAPIRFYSGNWMVPEVIDGDGNVNCKQVETDTVLAQLKRAVGPDGANYRFTFTRDNAQDHRKPKLYPVGLPLYPDWNVHEDFHPAVLEIHDVQLPPAGAKFTADKYRGQIEFQPFTIGDEVVKGVPRTRHLQNLRVYQAWYADKPCPACTPTTGWPPGAPGKGLVAAVYSGADNEPVFQFEAINGSGVRRTLNATDVVLPGERIVTSVTNYIMSPADFGRGLPPSGGLVPFDPAGNGTDYPLPWKNLCPYCRGTGMKPEYKIRGVEPELFAGRNNQINQPNGVDEIPVDADFTQTGPENWEAQQSRLSMRESAWVVVETLILKPQLPKYQFRNMAFVTQKATLTEADQANQFPNPLTFTTLRRRLPAFAGEAAEKIVKDEWTCEVPYTTIAMAPARCHIDQQLGRVIFDEPQVIPCRKQFTVFTQFEGQKYLITNNVLTPRGAGRGQYMADRNWNPTGFWRHARAWMTFYYTRDLYYEYMFTDRDGNAIPTTEFQYDSPDGQTITYQARTSIHDGRLVIEVRVKNPGFGQVGGSDFPTGNRVLQKALTDYDGRVETYLRDLYKMPLPTIVGKTLAEVEAHKRAAGLDFPRARMLKIEATTPGEIQAEMDGYTQTDYRNSVTRPKVFSWGLRDDRSRLLARAIRELEVANNILVSGVLRVVGISRDLTTGLGWIEKPGKGKAAVKRIQFNFTEGLQAELEITREEARLGEIVPKEQDLMHQVYKSQLDQGRIIDALRAGQAAQQQPPVNDLVQDVGTGSIGVYRGS